MAPLFEYTVTILRHPKPHIDVKNPLYGSMIMRLKMYSIKYCYSNLDDIYATSL